MFDFFFDNLRIFKIYDFTHGGLYFWNSVREMDLNVVGQNLKVHKLFDIKCFTFYQRGKFAVCISFPFKDFGGLLSEYWRMHAAVEKVRYDLFTHAHEEVSEPVKHFTGD